MSTLIHAAEALFQARKPFIIASIGQASGSLPRRPGAYMLVREDGSIEGTIGGGALESEAIHQALQALEAKKNKVFRYDLSNRDAEQAGMVCGGRCEIILEYYSGAPDKALLDKLESMVPGRLILIGGGHIALALARMAEILEMPHVVCDDRAEFVTAERFPKARRITLGWYDRVPLNDISARDAVVIITRGHLGDRGALEWVLGTSAGYIGVIGSKRKHEILFDKLRKSGYTEEQLERVYAPIGLAIGAQTPAEIAISILAQIIAHRAAEQKQ